MLSQILTMFSHTIYCPLALPGKMRNNRFQDRRRSSRCLAMGLSSLLLQTDENENSPESKKRDSSSGPALKRSHPFSQENTVGIIGGVSVFSTLIFLEKLAWWSTRDGGDCISFVVCSDPAVSKNLQLHTPYASHGGKRVASSASDHGLIIDNLQRKRAFLEQSGARYIVMPCYLSHAWYGEISEGSSLPFLHMGDCVARELKEAKLKPLEAGSNIRIGVLGTHATIMAASYQEKLKNQGFEVVLPDRPTMEHIVVPTIEAIKRKDRKGARTLLRIALQLLLIRAVNTIILASDEMQGVLPHDDPLLRRCIDPMDALARSTATQSKSSSQEDVKHSQPESSFPFTFTKSIIFNSVLRIAFKPSICSFGSSKLFSRSHSR